MDEPIQSLSYNMNLGSGWLALLIFSNWILVLIFSNRTVILKSTKLDKATCIDFDHPFKYRKKKLRDFFLPLGQNSEVLLAVISPHGCFELLRECPLSETEHILLLRTQIIFISAQLAAITICYS